MTAARCWPLGAGRDITSRFGPRAGEFHWGTDFGRTGGSAGMPVYAVQGGWVDRVGPASGFGWWVCLDHPEADGAGYSVYGHIVPEVTLHQRVEAGQRIGHINPDPDTNGGVDPHLHLEIHRSLWAPPGPDRLDPVTWLADAREPDRPEGGKPMGWTGDPVWLADVLRAAGLRVIEHDGWRDRGHGDFRDIRGVLCHHTAGGGANDWRIVQNGRPGLDGPLAQLVLERDGTYRLIAVGVCWHAGRGSWPGWPTDNANYHVIGIEAVSRGDGTDWTPAQLDAYRRGCAAILRRIGRGADSCVAHREYSSEGKIDPAGIDMDDFRRDVQELIDRPVTGPTPGGSMSDPIAEIHNQIGKPHPVRTVFQKAFYNVKNGEFWTRAGLADIWNEVVWDGYVNPIDLIDGRPDPDKEPTAPNAARRSSLIGYVLATYREATLARRNTDAILELLRAGGAR
ncbi:N-acetylmuramoyl-L-alanine amidase [Nocardia cyriacigeorgica]|uniref:N-acetylmuramoyl-L-alanine amidase n=1 Tax=Nocardia cyriacigeorgica TaxID=135487 RepID=UPI002811A89C|nr:N-acetylmuramoyl-L-alanine amidase [Nocardia cyriacigeorgica]